MRGVGSVLPVFEMAGIALSGKPEVHSSAGTLVAGFAGHSGMSAEQREAVLVILDPLINRLPAFHGVALSAIAAHLASMNVRVAVRAILADVGEDRSQVALNARNLFVHSPERIRSLIVIKFGNRADGAPAGSSMAVFARNGQWAVRIASSLILGSGKRFSN